MFRSIFALMVLVLGALTSQGCIVYDNGGYHEYAPAISSPYAGCAYDDYYGQSFWYFEANISDADGDLDYAAVDVYDVWGTYIESWELVQDGGNRFSSTVYEEYSRALDCRYSNDFSFEIWATDYSGNVSQVTVGGPTYVPAVPELTQPTVSCAYDSAYGDYYWDFSVYVSDPQGVGDVRDTVVSIFDPYYSDPVEEWDLYYDSYYGTWSVRVYEYYSYYLDCYYNPTAFGFQFSAMDWDGNLGWANATTVNY